ncbi:hypothetical protein IU451_28685 [Nocardia cyriacigeorgica]|uniref:hypothetical protein n=1 Tax=Nocardia cyriacigeorgica TaxID=135487 RepID=UPI001895873A|nr:hypothetical protein [Nocardia cyriacigeorgica]MBF6326479.1 hypothetical protein [Nocardia cyriacigeorgica]
MNEERRHVTVKTVASIAEWAALVETEDEPWARAVGVLADEIRERFGANKHVSVLLRQEGQWLSSGCDCCGDDYWQTLVIECGDEQARLHGDPDDVAAEYRDWLDLPRRQAEREAARARVRAEEEAVVAGIVSVFDRTIVDTSAPDWHDQLMTQLGVKGYRQAG